MKVLVLDTGDPSEVSGGQSVYVRNMLATSSHEVVVASSAPQGIRLGVVTERMAGAVKFQSLPIARHNEAGRRPLIPERLRCLLGAMAFLGKVRDADVLYVQSAELLAAALVHRRGRPVVFHVHGAANPLSVSRYRAARVLPLQRAYERAIGLMLRRTDSVLSVDRAGCEWVRSMTSPTTIRCELVTPCVDMDKFDVAAGKREEGLIAYIGRLEEAKAVDELLQALPQLSRSGQPVRLVIAGEGSVRQSLEALVDSLCVADRTTFVGWVSRDDLPQLLARCELVVLPSKAEGFPTILVESMACGIPVVARDVGGVRELVEPGVNGEVWDPAIEHLATAVTRALATEYSAQRVRESVAIHSCERVIARVDDLLRTVVRAG